VIIATPESYRLINSGKKKAYEDGKAVIGAKD